MRTFSSSSLTRFSSPSLPSISESVVARLRFASIWIDSSSFCTLSNLSSVAAFSLSAFSSLAKIT